MYLDGKKKKLHDAKNKNASNAAGGKEVEGICKGLSNGEVGLFRGRCPVTLL